MLLTWREWSGKKSNEWSNLAASSISATGSYETSVKLNMSVSVDRKRTFVARMLSTG